MPAVQVSCHVFVVFPHLFHKRLIGQAFAPYVTQCVGIDLSENMVAEYNKSVVNQGIRSSEMHAVIGNLLSPSDPSPASLSSPEFFNFDIAAVGVGFHHFDDPVFAAKQLVARLKPGGILFIIDFLPHPKMDLYNSPATHTVVHLGFSEEDVRRMFDEAGVGGDFRYVIVGKEIVFTHAKEEGKSIVRSVFMARGEKV